jgi:hypothetical protein
VPITSAPAEDPPTTTQPAQASPFAASTLEVEAPLGPTDPGLEAPLAAGGLEAPLSPLDLHLEGGPPAAGLDVEAPLGPTDPGLEDPPAAGGPAVE